MESFLKKIIDDNGNKAVDMAFTEYLMTLVASRNVLEEIRSCVKSGGTVSDIKAILEGTGVHD